MTSLSLSRSNAVILAACLVAGVAGYVVIGQPGMGDQPMSARQAALAEKIRTDPQSLTAAETLSRLEQAMRDNPKAPEPHFFIGEMLRAQGRPDDALRAYQSALRRNEDFVPALVSLADVLVEIGNGAVSPDATRLYARAYQLDETQVRAGMWAAMGAAQAAPAEPVAEDGEEELDEEGNPVAEAEMEEEDEL
jgi:cytochrome c-type biogenesis protein CcmH